MKLGQPSVKNVRIYQPGDYKTGETVSLNPSAAQHVAKVLRMKSEEPITLFSGDNHEYQAIITKIEKKTVQVLVLSKDFISRESPAIIHLAQSISKGERMELVIQKAVELGVASITPIFSERTVVKLDETRLKKKQAQWQAIAIAACEQCGRNQLPQINPATSYQKFIQQNLSSLKIILSPKSELSIKDLQPQNQDFVILIGPEGGFSEQEVEKAIEQAYLAVGLGPRILRTETAAITTISLLQAVFGDL